MKKLNNGRGESRDADRLLDDADDPDDSLFGPAALLDFENDNLGDLRAESLVKSVAYISQECYIAV